MGAKKVLVVEDDQTTATMLDSILKKNGYDVVVAHNGKMALLLMQGMAPDLIITDVMMPEMNGYEFYKQVKRTQDTADIPFIVLTSHGDMGEAFTEMDIDEFFSKPIDTIKLLSVVDSLVTKGRDAKKMILGASKRSSLIFSKNAWFLVGGVVALIFGLLVYFMSANLQAKKMGAPEYHIDGEVVEVVEE